MSGDPQFEKDIHERLLASDPTASEELCRRYLPLVQRHVAARAHNHGIHDEDLINDATVDAVFGYIRYPERFDPLKSGLLGYLKRAAERDLINVVQQDRRRRRGEELHENVEYSILARNKSCDIDRVMGNAEEELVTRIQTERDLAKVVSAQSDMDSAMLRLMAEGERRTSRFVAVLGIEGLSTSEQKRIVKQHKDRLKVRLKRGGRRA